MNNKIEKIYKNIKNPGGLSSVDKLYREIKKDSKLDDIKKKDVEKYLQGQSSHTLHKIKRHKFSRRKMMFPGPGHTLASDVFYINRFSKANNNIRYILVVMDSFSRFISLHPLSSLKASCVVPVFRKVLEDSLYPYVKLFTDEGIEYTSKGMKSLLKKHNITHYHTYSREIKVSIVERCILTLKRKIRKYLTKNNTNRFLHVLDDLAEGYNGTPHRGLLWKTPMEVYLMTKWCEIRKFKLKLYKEHVRKNKSVSRDLYVGDIVRIKSLRSKFSRSIDYENTREVFKISQIYKTTPVTYGLEDLSGKKIDGPFYWHELTKTVDPGIYDVEVLKTKKSKGKKYYLVNYIHFPTSSNEWIEAKNLEKK